MRLPVVPVLCVLLAVPLRAGATVLGDGTPMAGSDELSADKAALDQTDQKLDGRLRVQRGPKQTGPLRGGPREPPSWRRDGQVRVLVRLRRLDGATRDALGGAGLRIEHENAPDRVVEGWIAADAIRGVAALDGVRSVRPAERGEPRVGRFVTGGDAAARADAVRALGFDGQGVRVGVISDGIDGFAASQTTGDIGALTVPAGCSTGSGAEGRAMLEIVHDLAPGAELFFASGIDSPLSFVNAVQCLSAAGASVIVDDLGFFSEPYFEDGAVAQAVRAAVQAGVSYHSAAGNGALLHYEAPFRASPQSKYHDFNNGGAVDNTNRVLIPPGGSLLCVLQWDDPFGAAADDYDLFLLDDAKAVIAASNNVQNGRGDPLEFVEAHNDSSTTQVGSLAIQRDRGAARTLELFCVRDVQGMEHVTPGSSIFGHAGIPEAVAVAAIDVDDPGLDTVESYSSQGPARIAFPQPESRPKPDVSGFDGVTTGVAGFSPFFGTSAAAPHVAAVAALVLQKNPFLTPAEVQATLAATAVDIGPAGFDDAAGAGRVDALAAVNAVSVPECATDAECADTDPCTIDRCERGTCTHGPASCDDGNPCNGVEVCSPQAGGCVTGPQAPDGTPCPDATVCNGGETCQAGTCTAGTPLKCDDGDSCTEDTCAPEAGCQHTPLQGLSSISCVLDRGLPSCPGVELPRSIQRRFARAQQFVRRSGRAGRVQQQRVFVHRAIRALKSAFAAAQRNRRLPLECADAIAGSLGDARNRARAVVQSLR